MIGTKSATTGTVVLRHEMGHNFASVGEGYDGGSVYRGVNSAPDANNVGWAHWLTEPNRADQEQQAVIRLEEYPWYDLAEGPITFTFTSDGTYKRWLLRFTASGTESPGALKAFLDGKELEWKAPGTLDRSFFTFDDFTQGFSAGTHTLSFSLGTAPSPGRPIRQLCSLTMLEYREEAKFAFDNSYVAAYPTWSTRGVKTFRPNNEYCLMRNMTSEHFDPVCQEGVWYQFLARVSLIDEVDVDTSGSSTTISVKTIGLGNQRKMLTEQPASELERSNGPLPGSARTEREQIAFYGAKNNEALHIVWTQNGHRRADLNDKFSFTESSSAAAGSWEVHVQFVTDEIRADPNKLTESTLAFTVAE